MKEKVCIVGGGNVGTVLAGVMASNGYRVSVLTDRPEQWGRRVTVDTPEGAALTGPVEATSRPREALLGADVVLLCLPGPAISGKLKLIKPWLSPDVMVGSVFSCTGFFIMAIDELGRDARLFGLQRVPFISRLECYGHSARLLGRRDCIHMAFSNIPVDDSVINLFSSLFVTPVSPLGHPMEVTLTNSNPILHPSRLYSMFKDVDAPMDEVPMFYADWNDESSRLLIECDEEFQRVVKAVGLPENAVPRLLDYYESWDAASLTRKIRSIPAFKTIKAPMKAVEGGFLPDFDNRYFTEDFPYGLLLVKMIAETVGVATPAIDSVIQWYQTQVGRRYIEDGSIADSADTRGVACLDREAVGYLISTINR